jgi:lysyl-tRNA synthetase class I
MTYTVTEPPPLHNRFLTSPWGVVQCPQCESEVKVDQAQFNGGVAIGCECGFTDTVDLRNDRTDQ